MNPSSKSGRKPVAPAEPKNAWETTLEKLDHDEPSQAGEFEEGLEDGLAGGDKGLDSATGMGGYSGDVVEAGSDEADAQPERPLDAELDDPRTRAGEEYPEIVKRTTPDQPSLAREAELEREDEEGGG